MLNTHLLVLVIINSFDQFIIMRKNNLHTKPYIFWNAPCIMRFIKLWILIIHIRNIQGDRQGLVKFWETFNLYVWWERSMSIISS